MTRTTEKYINLFTDFGFKKLFGEEPNKDLLIAFLNELLGDQEHIEDLSYLKNERLGKNARERTAVYDLYCTNERGEKFIVEIQRVKQEFFKDRSVYYSTFAIQEQATKGKEWQYELKGVYTIAILDFSFNPVDQEKLEHRVKLLDIQTHQVFYDKLTFIYLEIPKFHKEIHELANDYEKWLFAFKNLHRLQEHPKELQAGIFQKLFELAEIAKMNQKEQSIYQESLKNYWDLKSSMDTYYKEGKQEGREEGKKEVKIEVAIAMKEAGESIEKIAKYTGLPQDEIEQLKWKGMNHQKKVATLASHHWENLEIIDFIFSSTFILPPCSSGFGLAFVLLDELIYLGIYLLKNFLTAE